MVDKDRCTFADMFKVGQHHESRRYSHHGQAISGVIFGAMITGQLQSLAPDYIKAKRSATYLYDLISRSDVYAVIERVDCSRFVSGRI